MIKSILFFNSMLTPKLITFLYWLMLLGAVISGFGSMFAMGYAGAKFSFAMIPWGLTIMVMGMIGARIFCELMIVLFTINDNLKKLVELNQNK